MMTSINEKLKNDKVKKSLLDNKKTSLATSLRSNITNLKRISSQKRDNASIGTSDKISEKQ